MGMSIGSAPLILGTSRRLDVTQPKQLVSPTLQPIGSSDGGSTSKSLPLRQEQESARLSTGFGRGTVSVGTAAVNTMNLGFRQARDVIPSIQETRARVRERVSEVRRAQTERATQLREAARNRPNPALEARRFVQTLNDVSATTAARLNNEEPPESEPRASIRVGGETYPYTQVNAPQQGLDVFA